jgi:hypothetical protein
MLSQIDTQALGLAIVVFLVAVSVAWALKRFQITDGVGFITVIILPIAAYGVASGYVAKISLPGGWAAEFRQIAAARITPSPLSDAVDDLNIIEKEGLAGIKRYRESLHPGKPIAISLALGRPGYYSQDVIAEYIRAFLTFDPNLTVIYVDQVTGKFVASSNANSVLAAVEVKGGQQPFIQALETGNLESLRALVVLTTATVSETTSNSEALQAMVADGVDSMIKTDANGIAIGLVRRDEIVSRLMITLAASN